MASRSDHREDIFLCRADRLVWLEIFSKDNTQFNWGCHAWHQTTKHYHVVVETVEGNLSQGMRQRNGVYTQQLNRPPPLVASVTSSRGATGRFW